MTLKDRGGYNKEILLTSIGSNFADFMIAISDENGKNPQMIFLDREELLKAINKS